MQIEKRNDVGCLPKSLLSEFPVLHGGSLYLQAFASNVMPGVIMSRSQALEEVRLVVILFKLIL